MFNKLKDFINNKLFLNDTFIKKLFFHKKIRFAVHLADHCNLNCKGCNHFSPLAKEHFLDVDVYEKDCQKFSSISHNKVKLVKLLGGEPLLHKDIVRIVELTRKYFPKAKIEIWTNGILLDKMKPDFYECCAKNKVLISITPYPIKLEYDKIKDIKKKYHVRIVKDKTMFHLTNKFRRYTLNLKGTNDPKVNFKKCRSSHCSTLYEGKYYMCNVVAFISYFNEHFEQNLTVTDQDFIDIHQIDNIESILKYRKNHIPFCRYCNVDDYNTFEDWEVSKKDISEWI